MCMSAKPFLEHDDTTHSLRFMALTSVAGSTRSLNRARVAVPVWAHPPSHRRPVISGPEVIIVRFGIVFFAGEQVLEMHKTMSAVVDESIRIVAIVHTLGPADSSEKPSIYRDS